MSVKKLFSRSSVIGLRLLALALILGLVAGLSAAENAHATAGRPLPRLGTASATEEAPSGKTIYVKKNATGSNNGTSWQDAFTNLQAALDDAVAGDQIWVAAGVYLPTYQTVISDPRSATFLLKQGVALYGGFAGTEGALANRVWRSHQTILSGDLQGDDVGFSNNSENSYHVVTANSVGSETRLDGFIIQNGNANSTTQPDNYGGGMYVGSASPTLVNLVLYTNYAVQGGGQYNHYSNSLIVNCSWVGNKAEFGGGLRNWHSNPILVNTLFDANFAGSRAGGIHNSYSNLTVMDSSLAYNWDNFDADSILNDNGSNLLIFNSIIWGNGDQQITSLTGGSVALFYSLSQDGCSGVSCTEVITDDPLFSDPDGADDISGNLDDDLRLSPTSPAIDHGDNSAVLQDSADIDQDNNTTELLPQDLAGAARFIDMPMPDLGQGSPPIIDMGAYEAQPAGYSLFLPIIYNVKK